MHRLNRATLEGDVGFCDTFIRSQWKDGGYLCGLSDDQFGWDVGDA